MVSMQLQDIHSAPPVVPLSLPAGPFLFVFAVPVGIVAAESCTVLGTHMAGTHSGRFGGASAQKSARTAFGGNPVRQAVTTAGFNSFQPHLYFPSIARRP